MVKSEEKKQRICYFIRKQFKVIQEIVSQEIS